MKAFLALAILCGSLVDSAASTPSDSHYRSHVVGLRLVHTTSTSQIQPRLLVGYSLRLSTAGEPVSMVDIGAGLGWRFNARTLLLGSVVRYQPLGRAGLPFYRQYAFRAGIAIGDF